MFSDIRCPMGDMFFWRPDNLVFGISIAFGPCFLSLVLFFSKMCHCGFSFSFSLVASPSTFCSRFGVFMFVCVSGCFSPSPIVRSLSIISMCSPCVCSLLFGICCLRSGGCSLVAC